MVEQKRGSAGAAATVLQAVSVCAAGVLPAFLVGALAVQMRTELGIGPAGIGLAAATLFAVAGLLARPLGLVVQRLGARRGLTISALLAAVSLGGAALARSYAVLLVALVVGGVANAMAQPAANLSISCAVGPSRLGLAFGIKQSSIPAASLLGGLAVPGVALTLGWRWAFVIGAVVALAVAVWTALVHTHTHVPAGDEDDVADRGIPRSGLAVLTLGAGLAAAGATSLGVFLVDSAVRSGLAPSAAGVLFAGSALLGLSVRVALGACMDRQPGRSPYLLIANLLTGGAVGYLLLGSGTPELFALGALLGYGAGWTWPGVLHFAVVRDNRLAAASATGFLQTGLSLGAAAGPLLFGMLVEMTSYRAAWWATAASAVAAAVIVRTGRRMVRRSRGMPVAGLLRTRR